MAARQQHFLQNQLRCKNLPTTLSFPPLANPVPTKTLLSKTRPLATDPWRSQPLAPLQAHKRKHQTTNPGGLDTTRTKTDLIGFSTPNIMTPQPPSPVPAARVLTWSNRPSYFDTYTHLLDPPTDLANHPPTYPTTYLSTTLPTNLPGRAHCKPGRPPPGN